METIRSRIVKVLNNQMPQDRLPLVEWAPWWSETVERWEKEGLPENMGQEKITAYWNLDSFPLISIMPDLPPEHTNVPYEEIKDKIFTRQALDRALNEAKAVAESQKKRGGGAPLVRWIFLVSKTVFWHRSAFVCLLRPARTYAPD